MAHISAVRPAQPAHKATRQAQKAQTRQALKNVEKALALGEQLEKTEQIAFAATQGLYDPQKGDFVSDGKPNMGYALKLTKLPKGEIAARVAPFCAMR